LPLLKPYPPRNGAWNAGGLRAGNERNGHGSWLVQDAVAGRQEENGAFLDKSENTRCGYWPAALLITLAVITSL